MIGIATQQDIEKIDQDIQIVAGQAAETEQKVTELSEKLDQLIEELKADKEKAAKK